MNLEPQDGLHRLIHWAMAAPFSVNKLEETFFEAENRLPINNNNNNKRWKIVVDNFGWWRRY